MEARIGEYQLIESLGHGGMGIVWKAQHLATGRMAALKTVRVPHAGMVASIRREIQALARVRHPGIIQILDEGLHDGMPWYAMELLSGVTLRHWRPVERGTPLAYRTPVTRTTAESSWTHSLQALTTLEEEVTAFDLELDATEKPARRMPRPVVRLPEDLLAALSLIRRLCFSLSYLHGEGLVHRDLKPDNILVRQNGQPVIVDFGLVSRNASERSRESLEVAGRISGTVSYMAPEQARGERVDARADLYSLGCILYQTITGRVPFMGRTALQVQHQHLATEPAPPSSLADGVPAELDELVLRLLKKEPRDRLGYADDVAAALAGLGVDAEPLSSAPAARPYLYRPEFSGRAEVLEPLRASLAGLHAGAGSVVLVEGESGVGKTRLLVELSSVASWERLRVSVGECQPMAVAVEGGNPVGIPLQVFRKWLQALADRCRERGPLETQELLGNRASILSAYEPTFADLPGIPPQNQPVELPPKEAQLRLYHALLGTLAAHIERDGELVLLLDDLQWADELSLGVLEALVRSGLLQRLPLLVVGVYRSEETTPGLRKLAAMPGVGLLKLERLEASAVAKIVSDMLGLDRPPANFSRFLVQQSEGNPFFVAEYLRAAVGQGLLYRDETGSWQVGAPDEVVTEKTYAALPLPSSLLELVSERLSRLRPETRRFVEAVSVLGREAEQAVAARVAGLSEADALQAVLDALVRQVLEPAEGNRLRFVHDKLREVALVGLPEHRRSGLHRAAAEALQGQARDEGLAVVAHHWQQCGELGRARQLYLDSARWSAAQHAYKEAQQSYQAALRLGTAETGNAEVRIELLGKVLLRFGQGQECLVEAEIAVHEAHQMGNRSLEAEALQYLGTACRRTGQLEASQHHYQQGLELARDLDQKYREVRLLNALGALYLEHGQIEKCQRLNEQALAILREQGDREGEEAVLVSLGNLHRLGGRVQQSEQLYRQALDHFRASGDRHNEGIVLGNLGLLHEEQSSPEVARDYYLQALAIHRETGNRRFEGVTLGNLGDLEGDFGRLEEALQLFQQALLLLREVGDRRAEAVFLGNLGLLHFKLGQPQLAQELSESALSIHIEMGTLPFQGFTRGNLALIHFTQGRMTQAREEGLQALSIAREVGSVRNQRMSLRFLAELELLTTGDAAAVHHHVQAAESVRQQQPNFVEDASDLCLQGHLALQSGADAQPWLLRIQERIAGTTALKDHDLKLRITHLEAAQASWQAGLPLVCGFRPEDLPPGQLRWLHEHRPETLPAGV